MYIYKFVVPFSILSLVDRNPLISFLTYWQTFPDENIKGSLARNFHSSWGPFRILMTFSEVFESKGKSPVLTTPALNEKMLR
jgi:hypothetical protein